MLPAYHLAKESIAPGPVYTLQGVLINSGDVGSALFSFVITYLLFTRRARLRTKTIAESGKRYWSICFLFWFIGIPRFHWYCIDREALFRERFFLYDSLRRRLRRQFNRQCLVPDQPEIYIRADFLPLL